MAFDPDAFVNNEKQERRKRESGGFDPDAFVASGTAMAAPQGALPSEAPSVAPAFIASGPTGINVEKIKQAAQPVIDIIPKTYQQYMGPGGAVKLGVDLIGGSTVGVPPVAALETARAVKQLPGAVKEAAGIAGQTLSAVADLNKPAFDLFYDSLSTADRAALRELVDQQGPKALRNFQLPDYAARNPAVAQAFETLRGQVPGTMTQLGRIAGPVLKGAAKVAGPAGLAYDIYQAQPYMAQGGQELQSGQAAERMRQARRSTLNAPTGAPLSRQEAENLIASGDQRLINIYRNDAEIANAIRRKAAEKVLGPVAPY